MDLLYESDKVHNKKWMAEILKAVRKTGFYRKVVKRECIMSEMERYDIGDYAEPYNHTDGDYILYSDYIAKVKELEAALIKYGKHKNDKHCFCEKYKSEKYPCTCGWEEVEKSIENE